ncbi:MAG TPA: fused MFS/spermidine synthase [Actinopolymorphaceae bacterium]
MAEPVTADEATGDPSVEADAPSPPGARRRGLAVIALYSLTILLSAALVFLVQPMFARLLLPMLGGTSSVWTASMLFFTTALLVGYLYVHVATRRMSVRRQALVHLALLALTCLTLPVGLPDWDPPTADAPVPWLLAALTVSIGLPFTLVSATSPLLQRWLAATDHPDAADPYFLYRASNVGSVLGLLAYPLGLEPSFGVREQTLLWSIGFAGLVLLLAACATVLWRRPGSALEESSVQDPPVEVAPAEAPDARARLTWRRRALWVALAFAPASLAQGVTTFLTVDLAPVPLLWVLPLGLYLFSWVVVFARGRRTSVVPRLLTYAFPFVSAMLIPLLVYAPSRPIVPIALAHLAGLLVVAVVCHGRLAADRPAASSLTEFYGWLALGGALGTGFNGVVAPIVFDGLLEYPLALLLATVLMLPAYRQRWLRRCAYIAPALVIASLAGVLTAPEPSVGQVVRVVVLTAALTLVFLVGIPWLRVGLVTGALVFALVAPLSSEDGELYGERNFFGVKLVTREGDVHSLLHGTTLHGAQIRTKAERREPMTYSHRTGPLGELVGDLPHDVGKRSAMVGLGAGSAACLDPPGGRWTFYEIDPDVVRMAENPALFSYLSECGDPDVVLGDARHSLSREPDREFGLIALDAFSSDAIPVHLLTREALTMYRAKLAPGGALAFHISNRYLELEPVLAALAEDLHMSCYAWDDGRTDQAEKKFASHWVVLGVRPLDPRWQPCVETGTRVWTDDYSNLLAAFRLD